MDHLFVPIKKQLIFYISHTGVVFYSCKAMKVNKMFVFIGVVSSNNTKIFSVKTGSSYLCKTKSDVKIDNVTISFEEIHVQAFLTKEDTNFGSG